LSGFREFRNCAESNLDLLTFQAIVASAFFRVISIDIDFDIEIGLFGSIDIGIDIDNRPIKLLILILVLIRHLLIILKWILNRFSGIDHVCHPSFQKIIYSSGCAFVGRRSD